MRIEIILNNFPFLRIMKVKEKPEDFIVKEVMDIEVRNRGRYLYFLLKKVNYNTIDAIEKIARALNIVHTRFGFAGNKDKFAITEQFVSVENVKKENIERIRLEGIEIKFLGYGDKPISLGDLEGNRFVITIRGLNEDEIRSFKSNIKKKNILIPNYFGEQRFSSKNVEVGKAIIKRNFEKATMLLGLDIIENDYIGALRKINKKILKLYVHSYQSYIFNETIRKYLKLDIKKNEKIPVVGFGTELEKYNRKLQDIINKILKKEKIHLRDFILPRMPELSEYGTERDLFFEVKELKVLEEGENWLRISFFLKKGCYATEAIKYLFNSI